MHLFLQVPDTTYSLRRYVRLAAVEKFSVHDVTTSDECCVSGTEKERLKTTARIMLGGQEKRHWYG